MKGKDKCRILKQIRQQIADANDIEYITRECTYQGDCRGTCPKCEAELRYLEEQLELRRNRGKKIAVAAIAAGIMLTTTTACDNSSEISEMAGAPPESSPDPTPIPTEVAEAPTMGEPPAVDYVVEVGEVDPIEVTEGEPAPTEVYEEVGIIDDGTDFVESAEKEES